MKTEKIFNVVKANKEIDRLTSELEKVKAGISNDNQTVQPKTDTVTTETVKPVEEAMTIEMALATLKTLSGSQAIQFYKKHYSLFLNSMSNEVKNNKALFKTNLVNNS